MLKEYHNRSHARHSEVLILILMEHAQRDLRAHGVHERGAVLILILMEHAQRVVEIEGIIHHGVQS